MPQDQINTYNSAILGAKLDRLDELNIKVNSITVSNGVLSFDGSIPTHVSSTPP